MNVCVTLTAYNEVKNIGRVIQSVLDQGYTCIVVDDGSHDGTPDLARSLGAKVFVHRINLGQGYAVLTSFKAALKESCDVIIEMDADGQHDPAEIPKFIEAFRDRNTDIVVGSRILGQNHPNAPFFRKTFLPYFTWVINRLTGYDMTDSMCGFRAFRAGSLKKVSPLLDAMLEPQYIAAEMFIRFSKAGLSVSEIPIIMQDRSSGSSYKGFIRYGFGVVKAIIRTLFDKKKVMEGGNP